MFDLFFWRSSFEVTLLYFALGNFFFYSVSIFKFKFIMLLSNLYFCLQFDVTLTKLLKRREIFVLLNKLCVFFVHILQVTHLLQGVRENEMFVFQKIWRALFSWNVRFDIWPVALLSTINRVKNKVLRQDHFY